MFGNRTLEDDARDVTTAAWAVESAVRTLMGPKPNLDAENRRRVDAAQTALIEADALLKVAARSLA